MERDCCPRKRSGWKGKSQSPFASGQRSEPQDPNPGATAPGRGRRSAPRTAPRPAVSTAHSSRCLPAAAPRRRQPPDSFPASHGMPPRRPQASFRIPVTKPAPCPTACSLSHILSSMCPPHILRVPLDTHPRLSRLSISTAPCTHTAFCPASATLLAHSLPTHTMPSQGGSTACALPVSFLHTQLCIPLLICHHAPLHGYTVPHCTHIHAPHSTDPLIPQIPLHRHPYTLLCKHPPAHASLHPSHPPSIPVYMHPVPHGTLHPTGDISVPCCISAPNPTAC